MLTGHFQSFFIYFFRPPDPKSEKKNPVNQLIKKIWPKKPSISVNMEICVRDFTHFPSKL